MVGRAVAHPAATPELGGTAARNHPTGEIAPRRGNVHDVGAPSPTSASSAGRFYEVPGKGLPMTTMSVKRVLH